MREGYLPGTFYLVFAGPVRDLRIVRGGRSPAEECGDRDDRSLRVRRLRPVRRGDGERPVAAEQHAARHRPTSGGPSTASDAEGRVHPERRIGADRGLPAVDPPSARIPRMEAGRSRGEDQRTGERDRETRIRGDYARGRSRPQAGAPARDQVEGTRSADRREETGRGRGHHLGRSAERQGKQRVTQGICKRAFTAAKNGVTSTSDWRAAMRAATSTSASIFSWISFTRRITAFRSMPVFAAIPSTIRTNRFSSAGVGVDRIAVVGT